MIDWVTAIIPFEHEPLFGGSVVKIAPDGEIEWEAPCRVSVEGSHEASISVKSQGGDGRALASELYIHGNPSKYLQGHNIFGIDDLNLLVKDTFISLCSELKLPIPEATMTAVEKGDYKLNRVDINHMYSLGNIANVKSWLRAAEYKSKTRHGRPSSKGGTLYWGKNSRRWAIKAYCKGEEIAGPKAHRLPERFNSTPLAEFAQDKLRIELVLRSKELDKLNLFEAHQWDDKTPRQLFNNYVKRIEMNEQMTLPNDVIHQLPHKLMSTYTIWKDGYNPRELMSKPTFYRHRRELLKHGIDIDLAVEKVDRSNVVPLVRVLEAQPVITPHWAYELGLVHAPPTKRVSNG
ncbi:MAG: Replication-associated protein G2P [Gammaproteobacteria bacterium]|nr:Replication-associated protein G2P [Gammaproteobacteria bacterium]